jgi:hypothetical protein
MVWRSAIVAGYAALAVVIGAAYGSRGLVVLLFFYAWAGAWVVFMLVWGRVARAAGHWSCERASTAPTRREGREPRPGTGEEAAAGDAGVAPAPPPATRGGAALAV